MEGCKGNKGRTMLCGLYSGLCGKMQGQSIIGGGEFKQTATRIMFKYYFKYCTFGKVKKSVLKLSAVLNFYNHPYLTAHQEHSIGDWDVDYSVFKKCKLPYLILWSIAPVKFKGILSVPCSVLVIVICSITLMRVQIRRE